MAFFGLFGKEKKETLDKGLEKTKESVLSKIGRAIAGKTTIDDDVLDNLEEALITSDVGVETTLRIIERIQERVKRDKYMGTAELNRILVDEVASLLAENNSTQVLDFADELPCKPYVIMVVGVNGVGKTTTIGKLAHQYKQAGKKVYLGAADTFRAAAVEQLCIWGERVGVPVIKQQQGSDPASVAFDTLSSAKANDADVVLIDTAGRLHNKINPFSLEFVIFLGQPFVFSVAFISVRFSLVDSCLCGRTILDEFSVFRQSDSYCQFSACKEIVIVKAISI